MRAITDIQCFVLDMDGTIYLGNEIIDGAIEFINTIKSTGRESVSYTHLTGNTADLAKVMKSTLESKHNIVEIRKFEEGWFKNYNDFDFFIFGSPKHYEYIPLFFLNWIQDNLSAVSYTHLYGKGLEKVPIKIIVKNLFKYGIYNFNFYSNPIDEVLDYLYYLYYNQLLLFLYVL